MLKGTIIESSLSDTSILKDLETTKTWQDGSWTLHSILIDENKVEELSKYLADGSWYIHLWKPGNDTVTVVFKNKIFTINFSDKSSWADAIAYGQSIGIPKVQLDFPID